MIIESIRSRRVFAVDGNSPEAVAEIEAWIAENNLGGSTLIQLSHDLSSLQLEPGELSSYPGPNGRAPRYEHLFARARANQGEWTELPELPNELAQIRFAPLDLDRCFRDHRCITFTEPGACISSCAAHDVASIDEPTPPRELTPPAAPASLEPRTCRAGWTKDTLEFGSTTLPVCRPPPRIAEMACSGTQAQFWGENVCSDIGPACGDTRFASDLPSGAPIIFVDVAAAGPGTGTEDDPYSDLQYAVSIATEGTVIALAEGNYPSIRSHIGLTLWGKCVDGTRVRGQVIASAGQRYEFRNLQIETELQALIIEARVAEAQIENLLIGPAAEVGVLIVGGEVSVRNLVVRGRESGLHMTSAHVDIERTVIEQTSIPILGRNATVTVDRTAIRNGNGFEVIVGEGGSMMSVARTSVSCSPNDTAIAAILGRIDVADVELINCFTGVLARPGATIRGADLRSVRDDTATAASRGFAIGGRVELRGTWVEDFVWIARDDGVISLAQNISLQKESTRAFIAETGGRVEASDVAIRFQYTELQEAAFIASAATIAVDRAVVSGEGASLFHANQATIRVADAVLHNAPLAHQLIGSRVQVNRLTADRPEMFLDLRGAENSMVNLEDVSVTEPEDRAIVFTGTNQLNLRRVRIEDAPGGALVVSGNETNLIAEDVAIDTIEHGFEPAMIFHEAKATFQGLAVDSADVPAISSEFSEIAIADFSARGATGGRGNLFVFRTSTVALARGKIEVAGENAISISDAGRVDFRNMVIESGASAGAALFFRDGPIGRVSRLEVRGHFATGVALDFSQIDFADIDVAGDEIGLEIVDSRVNIDRARVQFSRDQGLDIAAGSVVGAREIVILQEGTPDGDSQASGLRLDASQVALSGFEISGVLGQGVSATSIHAALTLQNGSISRCSAGLFSASKFAWDSALDAVLFDRNEQIFRAR